MAAYMWQIQVNAPPRADKKDEGYQEDSEPFIRACSLWVIEIVNEAARYQKKKRPEHNTYVCSPLFSSRRADAARKSKYVIAVETHNPIIDCSSKCGEEAEARPFESRKIETTNSTTKKTGYTAKMQPTPASRTALTRRPTGSDIPSVRVLPPDEPLSLWLTMEKR